MAKEVNGGSYVTEFENEIKSMLSGLSKEIGNAHEKFVEDLAKGKQSLEDEKAAFIKEKEEFEKERTEWRRLKSINDAKRKAREDDLNKRLLEMSYNEECLEKRRLELHAGEDKLDKKLEEYRKKSREDSETKFQEESLKSITKSVEELLLQLVERTKRVDEKDEAVEAARKEVEEREKEVRGMEMKNRHNSDVLREISEAMKYERCRFDDDKRKILEKEESQEGEIILLKMKVAELEAKTGSVEGDRVIKAEVSGSSDAETEILD